MSWDQNTMMPPGGAEARADMAGTLIRTMHARQTDPEIDRLLSELEPWTAGMDPDSDDARLVKWVRRDYEKTVRVPADLAAEMSRARALGQQSWQEALAANDFSRFRDALAQQFELRHRYVACFDDAAHPYDVLLDDFEPGLTTAALRPLFAELRDALVPLVAAAGDPDQPRNDGIFNGSYPVELQRAAVTDILHSVGYDPDHWRLDPAIHPFAQAMAPSDVRITTKYDEHDFGVTLYSVLHEFGHGLYEAGPDPSLARTTLGEPVSLGVHESQSRMWENIVGRSLPFCTLAAPAPARAARRLRGRRRRPALPRGQQRPAVADPHRGRRDHLQPPHRPALRARAGADGGHARGRRPARAPGTRACSGCSGSRCPATPRACSRTRTGRAG